MQMEPVFPGRGIDVKRSARISTDAICGVLFYIALTVQVAMCAMVFAGKNAEVMTWTWDGVNLQSTCPEGMVPVHTCARQVNMYRECITESLCDELRACNTKNGYSRRLAEEWPEAGYGSWKEAMEATAAGEGPHADAAKRRLNHGVDIPESIWEFMEEHAYVPTVLFGGVFFVSGLWLLVLQQFPRTTVWTTIITDIVLLLLFFIWFKIETDNTNMALPILAGVMTLGAYYKRKAIDQAAAVMKAAMDGLASNKKIFLVCAGVTCIWAAFFALWVAAIIGMSFVKEVAVNEKEGRCELWDASWTGGATPAFFLAMLYWVTYFLRNVNLMVVTSTVIGWYFNNEGYAYFWIPALRWGFFDLSGGNAIASATMGISAYILDRVKSKCAWVMALINPADLIILAIGCMLQSVLHAFTKYGLIAQVYSGKPFCDAAFAGMKLLKGQLGDAVLTDYIGTRVMQYATYIISLCVAFAAWGWCDAVQGVDAVSGLLGDPGAMLFIMIVFSWLLSMPFWCLLLVIVLETALAGIPWTGDYHEIRAVLNSIFVSLFVGSITYFILQTVSQIVVNAMDAIFFSFAVEANTAIAKQPRFEQLYGNLKAAIAPGSDPQNAVMGAPPGAQVIEVQVPHGLAPGATMQASTPQGRQFEVAIPEGHGPGSMMAVMVPDDPSKPATVLRSRPAAPAVVRVVGNAVPDVENAVAVLPGQAS